jgi:hypothetical protein
MEDNFTLRYVLKYPGVNSRAELVPSLRAYARNGALRRWLGGNALDSLTILISVKGERAWKRQYKSWDHP